MHLLLGLLLALQVIPPDSIAKLRDQWARSLHDKKIESSMDAYAANADFIQPDGTRVHGIKALRELFTTVTAALDSDLVFTSDHFEQSGDLACDSGTYKETLTLRATGKAKRIAGSYLTLYRRSEDGSWLIVEQMWTLTSEEPEK